MPVTDLARLFSLARDYHAQPSLYRTRASSYEITGKLYTDFVGMLMDPSAYPQQYRSISGDLEADGRELMLAGIHLLNQVIFGPGRNFYQILGVSRDASADTIRSHYRKLIPLFHPDRNTASRELDVVSCSALLNQAYNTLKKQEARVSYDRQLTIKPAITVAPRRSQSARNRASGRKHTASNDISMMQQFLHRFPIMRTHPKSAIWSMMLLVFVLMILLSTPDDKLPPPVVKVTGKLPVSIERLNESTPVQPDSKIDSDDDAQEYLQESVESKALTAILEKPADVEQSAPLEAMLDSSVTVQQPNTIAPPDADNPVTANRNSSHVASRGFDGGPPGTINDVNRLLTRSIGSGRAGLRGENSMAPELMMMRFVQGYESGDLSAISRLFANNVRTNNAWGRDQLLDQLSALFSSTSFRKIQIKQLKVEPRSQSEALLISDIQAAVLHENEPAARHYNGEIVFRLVNSQTGMQIAEMMHSVH